MTRGIKDATCTCWPKASVDGYCTEWSCIYHGQENRRLQMEQRAKCPLHGKRGSGDSRFMRH